ncbi:hypothetical protein [Streptomyces sp. NPDC003247]|uniref:hypothetical protein n=1 Tax=Streptomyces sp. NPDC003247 TaxID=3364677 RepID=UPI0036ABB68D
MTEYIEREQIGPENQDLLRTVGNHFFEDSLACETSLFWTWEMLAEFRERRGYDLVVHLPLLFVQGRDTGPDTYWAPGPLPRPDFDLPDGAGDRVRQDFHRTLTARHLVPLQRWARTPWASAPRRAAWTTREPVPQARSTRRVPAVTPRRSSSASSASASVPWSRS